MTCPVPSGPRVAHLTPGGSKHREGKHPACSHTASHPQSQGVRACRELSPIRLLVTPWTVARQAPPSVGFSRQGNWSGLAFPPPGSRTRNSTQIKCFLIPGAFLCVNSGD